MNLGTLGCVYVWGYSFCLFWIYAQGIILKCRKVGTPKTFTQGLQLFIFCPICFIILSLSLSALLFLKRAHFAYGNWGLRVAYGTYLRGPTLEAQNWDLQTWGGPTEISETWTHKQIDPRTSKDNCKLKINVSDSMSIIHWWVNCYPATLVFRNRKA